MTMAIFDMNKDGYISGYRRVRKGGVLPTVKSPSFIETFRNKKALEVFTYNYNKDVWYKNMTRLWSTPASFF